MSKNGHDDLESQLRAMIPDASFAMIDRRELDQFVASNPTQDEVRAWAKKKVSEGVAKRKRILEG
jgi:hypothetical protein